MVTSGRGAERGMTLVEIMVTLVISAIIAASTFMFFAGQQRIYDTQTKLLNIQQNLWAAMEVVARYTRASGGGMFECVRPANYANPTPGQEGKRIQSTSPSPDPLSANLATRPATGVRSVDPQTGTAMQWIPPLWIVNNACCTNADCTSPSCPTGTNSEASLHVRPATDILTVAFGNRTSGTDVDAIMNSPFTNTGDPISLNGTGTGGMFRVGEFVLLLVTPDWGWGTNPVVDRGCTMFVISSITPGASDNLLHQHGAPPTDWNPSGNVAGMLPPSGYAANSSGVRNFGTLTWVSFFIKQEGNGLPRLMMQQRHLSGTASEAQILAEGIEDLQISFACDTGDAAGANLDNLDGQLNEGVDDDGRKRDEWRNNVPGDVFPALADAAPGYCNLPTAVRITLVARTLGPDDLIDPTTGNGPLDIEDHRFPRPLPPALTDQFRRRVLTTTVYPRNNKPL
jgi:prepilin-type N-terminal cleavage/methylation domain-containing protein